MLYLSRRSRSYWRSKKIDMFVQTDTRSVRTVDLKNVLVNQKLFLVLSATLRKFWISYNGITVVTSNMDVEILSKQKIWMNMKKLVFIVKSIVLIQVVKNKSCSKTLMNMSTMITKF